MERLEDALKALSGDSSSREKVDVNDNRFSNGWPYLHEAAEGGNLEAVKCLIRAGADVNKQEGVSLGFTPLHAAADFKFTNFLWGYATSRPYCTTSNHEVVSELISSGAAVDSLAHEMITPISLAAKGGDTLSVGALISAGANINPNLGYEGRRRRILIPGPLYEASKWGHVETVRFLLSAGALVQGDHPPDENASTPLHTAAVNGCLDVVKVLIEAGADVNAVKRDGETPLYVAKRSKKLDIVKALIAAGAVE